MIAKNYNEAKPWAFAQAGHILGGPEYKHPEALRRKIAYWIRKWIESANHYTQKGNHLEARIHWGVVGILMRWAKNVRR